MNISKAPDAKRFTIAYSFTLFVIGVLLILCHEFWAHNLAHTLVDLTGLLVAPLLFSSFFHPRRYYLLNITITLLIVAWIFIYIHDTLLESFSILIIIGILLYIFCDLIGRMIQNHKGIEEELLFEKDALETRVELRTAELQFLNRQLTADLEMLKKADLTRQQSEMRLRTLINAIPDSILRIRCDGICLEYKSGKEDERDNEIHPDNEFLLTDILPENIARYMLANVQTVLETQRPQQIDYHFEKQGTVHIFEARLVVLSDLEVLVMIRDMTERKRLEKEILEISQREQNRIGQDLHDGLGQLLTGISCLLRGLTQKMQKRSPDDIDSVNEISDLVKQAIAQSSWLARGLMPVKLEAGGLEGSLQDLIEQTERIHNIPCLLHCDPDLVITDSIMLIHLYRIAQEALNNAVKHSRAKHIWVHLQPENGFGILTVKDDGIGLPKQENRTDGMGLRIMKYRAGMMGAELEILRDTEGGTVVQCRFKKNPSSVTKTSIME